MLSGYNTDVRYGDVVFHVQTEDKGLENPFIESLIYLGGRVVATKRAGYSDLLEAGQGTGAIAELMDRQHRAIVAGIRSGRLHHKLSGIFGGHPHAPLEEGGTPTGPPALASQLAVPEPAESSPGGGDAEPPPPAGELDIDNGQGLDQLILDYLNTAARRESLTLEMSSDGELALGRSTRTTFRALTSGSGRPVLGADLSVKLISTVSRPVTLASGRTDRQGILELTLGIPVLERGTAALIITALSPLGSAEIKYLL